MYKELLACQDILKKVSKVLGLDATYKVNNWLETMQAGAKEHNEQLELALIDFTTGKKAHDENLRVKDKVFKEKKYVYLDLEQIELDKPFFDENIQLFENLWGKRFWENV